MGSVCGELLVTGLLADLSLGVLKRVAQSSCPSRLGSVTFRVGVFTEDTLQHRGLCPSYGGAALGLEGLLCVPSGPGLATLGQ